MSKDLQSVNQALVVHRLSNIELQVLVLRSIEREIADDEIRQLMNYELI